MRVIAGRFRGRPLTPPADMRLRPTTDRVRESLFNMLAHGLDLDWKGARVADIFAGTGALGIEALSRGAAHATFVDNHGASLALVKRNLGSLGIAREAKVLKADAAALPPATAPFDLLFLDPPYGRDLVAPALQSLATGGWLRPGSLVVIESGARDLPALPASLTLEKERALGDTHLLIARVA